MFRLTQSRIRLATTAVSAAILAGAAGNVCGALLFWDGTDPTPSVDGGSGTWDLTTPNWSSHPLGDMPQTWVQGSEANFGGPGGTVTVAAPIQASAISGAANPITLTGGPIEVGRFKGIGTFTVNSSLKSFLLLDGSPRVILNGDNSAIPGVSIAAAGTVVVDGNGQQNRLAKGISVSVGASAYGTFEIRGRDPIPTGSDAIGVLLYQNLATLRVVSGASALSGATESHSQIGNIAMEGNIELAYSGSGFVYDGESFLLNGDVTLSGGGFGGIRRIYYGPGANGSNAGVALNGARTFSIGTNPRGTIFMNVEAELEDGDASAAPGKLIKTGAGPLSIRAPATYSGGTEVNGGTLFASVDGALGTGNVTVTSGLLAVGVSNAIADGATLYVAAGPKVSMGTGVNETVFGLVLDGTLQPNGTYGSSTSAAQFKNDQFFSGSGMLTVVPEPTGFAAAAGLGALFCGGRRRRRA